MTKKNAKVAPTKIEGKVDAVAYVLANGTPAVDMFADQKTLQKFYKQLDTPTLEGWVTELGLTYKACADSEPIHRMRVCMAILYTYFPKESTSKKAASPYAKYSLEDLVNLALENEVAIEETDDERILRMRLIMALRANKVIS